MKNNAGEEETTIYIRDAAGNVLTTYEMVNVEKNSVPGQGTGLVGTMHSKRQKEVNLYGSSRLGALRKENEIWLSYEIRGLSSPKDMTASLSQDADAENAVSIRGSKVYELTNHLGNLLATVSDKKLWETDNIQGGRYIAQVKSANDYYPFGWQMPGRAYQDGEGYRYGFNGHGEKS